MYYPKQCCCNYTTVDNSFFVLCTGKSSPKSICLSLRMIVCVCLAPSVLRECGRHTERQQPDHRVHRRQDVLLESGHALPASGTQNSYRTLVKQSTQPASSI